MKAAQENISGIDIEIDEPGEPCMDKCCACLCVGIAIIIGVTFCIKFLNV